MPQIVYHQRQTGDAAGGKLGSFGEGIDSNGVKNTSGKVKEKIQSQIFTSFFVLIHGGFLQKNTCFL